VPRSTSDLGPRELAGPFTADEEADTACLSALAAGAVYREPPDDLVETANLVTIYDRRARHLADRGVATVGFERAVERLRLVGGSVRIGSVHTDDFNFCSSWMQPSRSLLRVVEALPVGCQSRVGLDEA
jgi:hypothetical protein